MARAPAKQTYLYTGPVTPLDVASRPSRMLYPGKSYSDLPADDAIVQNLIERRLLTAQEITQPTGPIADAATSEGA